MQVPADFGVIASPGRCSMFGFSTQMLSLCAQLRSPACMRGTRRKRDGVMRSESRMSKAPHLFHWSSALREEWVALQANCSHVGREDRTQQCGHDQRCTLSAVVCTAAVWLQHCVVRDAVRQLPPVFSQLLPWPREESPHWPLTFFFSFSFSKAVSANTWVFQVTWTLM